MFTMRAKQYDCKSPSETHSVTEFKCHKEFFV